VFTEKILLYAGNFCVSSPLILIIIGTIYFLKKAKYISFFTKQSAGNFSLVTNTTVVTKNTYTKYSNLPKISIHVPNHRNNLTEDEFGYFLAGLIEGDG